MFWPVHSIFGTHLIMAVIGTAYTIRFHYHLHLLLWGQCSLPRATLTIMVLLVRKALRSLLIPVHRGRRSIFRIGYDRWSVMRAPSLREQPIAAYMCPGIRERIGIRSMKA